MPAARPPLSRDRVVADALALADARARRRCPCGPSRRALGVEAMSLYHHVAGKEALLDAMVDASSRRSTSLSSAATGATELRARSISGGR